MNVRPGTGVETMRFGQRSDRVNEHTRQTERSEANNTSLWRQMWRNFLYLPESNVRDEARRAKATKLCAV